MVGICGPCYSTFAGIRNLWSMPLGITLFLSSSSSFCLPKGQMKERSVFSERSVYVNRKGREKCDEKTVLNKGRRGTSLSIFVLRMISVPLYTSMSHCSPAVLLKDLQVIVINLVRSRDCHIPQDSFKRYLNLRNSHLCHSLSIQLMRIFCFTPDTSFSASSQVREVTH